MMMRQAHVSRENFSVAPSAQNAKLRALTKAESSASLNDGFAGFTKERQWPKAKSMLSARYYAPSHGRLVGLKGESVSTRLVLFGPLQTTWNSLQSM
jgi:hypothetical protein